ncbi:LysR family transcriptional regulator [Pseudorhodoferax sp. Leaf265]|jgi:DNA-binding transcriptional LysR family regulator|uniref:LysR family transcriptional regulator n=1 Tax=Pseudorhodoferax sp. Leaf265 TaxID=1736315 RepID=UPI0006FE19D8|nr:LysR family transcriptional regulator [Pseudorhodoferax sp. Leaf265]KQP09111.1 LysR family transcriptional regulator [Pseudorhodoferax sp. Leaf265]PZQ03250.1 MAG: LysR family transcriptional regulator [Variovorax paradoxus]PZQ17524.1 MAG: LysR family transcriptional regulator [Variovorax paradoxus]
MPSHPPSPRDVLTPDALAMLQAISSSGSFAAAARALGLVPSALTYRVRQIEDALDVLLFDRSSRQARLTEAGAELMREGQRLLHEIDAVANRVRRVATGWEPQLTLAVDSVISRTTMLDLCEAFYAIAPPTRLKLREEVLSGTLEALVTGQADLAIGVVTQGGAIRDLQVRPLGKMRFVYAMAPHHPLAQAAEPLADALVQQHRAVAVADSAQRANVTLGLLGGQDVLTVPTMRAKLEAQLRGLGCGFLPENLARPYIDTGRLVARRVQQPERVVDVGYAWHAASSGLGLGRAVQWWLQQLESPATRAALLNAPHAG